MHIYQRVDISVQGPMLSIAGDEMNVRDNEAEMILIRLLHWQATNKNIWQFSLELEKYTDM